MSSSTSRRNFLKSSAFGMSAGLAGSMLLNRTAPVAAQDAGSSKLYEGINRGTLIVGTGGTNPPWHFDDESGNLMGFDIKIAKLLAKGLFDDPSKVDFVREASDARIPNLQTGQVNVVVQFMTVTAQRAQVVEFSIPKLSPPPVGFPVEFGVRS